MNDLLPELTDLVRPSEGLVRARVFADPEIYRLEMERVFARSWLFLAHESEIPQPGDFVTRRMGEDPVIVVRGTDGQVRVLLNVCRHRGRKVCAEDAGSASHFRCGYHGWTYSNVGQLTGVPFAEAYQGKLDKDQLGLCEVPGVDTYHGLIFATWDPTAGSLADYLGEMTWTLDLLFGRTDGVEVVGPPQRWETDSNWKLGAGNFASDGTHLFTTHAFSTALGLNRLGPKPGAGGPPVGYVLPAENGHGCVITCWPPTVTDKPYLALPRELWPEIEQHLTPHQVEVLKSAMIAVGTVFPNTSFLNTSSHTSAEWGGPEGQAISFLTLRQWQPKGPDKMEVLSWLFVEKNAPESWKETSRQCYQRVFGMAGVFEQDDMENWAQITQAVSGPMASQLDLHYEMGLQATPLSDWAGPGVAYRFQPPFVDLNERVFYGRWQQLMASG
ncbi:MAG TPA: aromatic ring-hydroxylating dioxygenase subunit alpha [Chloroflexota bacterium]|nr:aromatic ring-hydroxylating dioxygenase subunit alpha [Chloroflexota bacterium]